MDLMDHRLSGTTALPLAGGVRGEEEGEGSLAECRCRALCFEQPGHGAKEALVPPFSGTDCHNHINYLLRFQCVRLRAKPFKCANRGTGLWHRVDNRGPLGSKGQAEV